MSDHNTYEESEMVKKLMDVVRSMRQNNQPDPTLHFMFHPHAIGHYGIEGSQWQATLRRLDMTTTDYGYTIEQAAERLLDRLLYPEKYPEGDD